MFLASHTAVYIAPEKQTPKMFVHCTKYGPETCIGVRKRREAISQQNKPLTAEEAKVRVDKNKHHLLELQEKLKAQGVDCLFQVYFSFFISCDPNEFKGIKSASTISNYSPISG